MIRCKIFSTKSQAESEIQNKNVEYGYPKVVDETIGGTCTITEVTSVSEAIELVDGRWAVIIDEESSYLDEISQLDIKQE